MEQRRVAIVGGGISGLAAAERLRALDNTIELHLFEVGERLGGVLQTENVDGFCLEQGPDSMLSRLPWAMDLCRRIGFEQELVSTNASPSGVYMVGRGRLLRVPEGLAIMAPRRIWPMVTTQILSWPGKLRMAAEYFLPRRRDGVDESLADFTRRRFGRETLERLVQPLAGGIYMGDPERLSIQATFPQFVEMEREHGSLIKATRREQAKGTAKDTAGGPQYSLFVAPRRGMAQLVERLAESVRPCEFHLRQRVERIRRNEGGGWLVDVADSADGSSRQVSFDGVILALPACNAGPMVAEANPELAAHLSRIAYAGCVVVNLVYDRGDVPHPLDSFGFVTPHIEGRSVLACTFSNKKYPGRAPENTLLARAFLGGDCFPEVMTWSDERVLEAIGRDLRDLLGITAVPKLTRIKRWNGSMPQYYLGHLDLVQKIESLAAELPCFELAGNYFRGVGIPHCIRSGAQASERLVEALNHTCATQTQTKQINL